MGFRELLISSVLVGLFVIAFLNFVYISTINNSPDNALLKDKALNQTFYSLNNSMQSYQTTAQKQLNATESETISSSFGALVMFSIIGAGRVFTGMITGTFNSIFLLATQTLGIPAFVIGIFITIIIITIIFLSWRIYRWAT